MCHIKGPIKHFDLYKETQTAEIKSPTASVDNHWSLLSCQTLEGIHKQQQEKKKDYLSDLVRSYWPWVQDLNLNPITLNCDPTPLINGHALNREQCFMSDESPGLLAYTLRQFLVTKGMKRKSWAQARWVLLTAVLKISFQTPAQTGRVFRWYCGVSAASVVACQVEERGRESSLSSEGRRVGQ